VGVYAQRKCGGKGLRKSRCPHIMAAAFVRLWFIGFSVVMVCYVSRFCFVLIFIEFENDLILI
jgi:hypothetical protein